MKRTLCILPNRKKLIPADLQLYLKTQFFKKKHTLKDPWRMFLGERISKIKILSSSLRTQIRIYRQNTRLETNLKVKQATVFCYGCYPSHSWHRNQDTFQIFADKNQISCFAAHFLVILKVWWSWKNLNHLDPCWRRQTPG